MSNVTGFGVKCLEYGAVAACAGLGPGALIFYTLSRAARESALNYARNIENKPQVTNNNQDRFG